ncbi:hypothetical protein [Campylobacter suis]|uniref:Uncharacterized protein n=1 Tax=Campylobacter suis TaxID=2790657 RepID=A0ABM8Q607_9BACT|nr:hypothetical protein [Campylobacter suis]CAD7288258.1 hypothetical protein LMG8286_01226 [Campylobacter suis]
MKTQKEFTIKAGTIISIKGLPFRLEQDVRVSGTNANYKLALSQSEHSLLSPCQAAKDVATSSTTSLSLPSKAEDRYS